MDESRAKQIMRSKVVALDTETATSDPADKKGALKALRCRLRGVSLAWEHQGGVSAKYWSFDRDEMPAEEAASRWDDFKREVLVPLFARKALVLAFHNASFDLKVMRARGLTPQAARISDTMIMDFLLDENRPHDLKSCARDHLGIAHASSHSATQKEIKEIVKSAEKAAKDLGQAVWEVYRDFHKGTMALSEINKVIRSLLLALPGKAKKADVMTAAHEHAGRQMIEAARGAASERFAAYATNDARWTLELHRCLLPRVQEEGFGQIYWNLYQALLRQTVEMEVRGVRVDVAKLKVIQKTLEEKLVDVLSQIRTKFGPEFNPASAPRVKNLLWVQKKLQPPPWMKKSDYGQDGMPSSGEDVIEWHVRNGEKDLEDLLVFRKLQKTKGTYVDALIYEAEQDPEGRIHTSFSLIKRTARFGSSDPNLQNLPRWATLKKYIPDIPSIRACFVPEDGLAFLSADFSQCDLRCMAHFTRDPALWRAYRTWKCPSCKKSAETNKPLHACPVCGEPDADSGGKFVCGDDIHTQTAVQTGLVKKHGKKIGRDKAKGVNFGAVYLMGHNTLANQLDIPVQDAKVILDNYHAAHPGVKAYSHKIYALVEAQGYFRMLNGQKRRFTDDLAKIHHLELQDSEAARKKAWRDKFALMRELMNNTGQCGTAVIINTAMFLLWRGRAVLESAGIRPLLQVHDELLFEGPRGALEEKRLWIRDTMERAGRLDVPVFSSASVCENWEEK